MGAVSFSLDTLLVDALQDVLPLKVFVETGTFQGDSLDHLKNKFFELHSIELSPEHYERALIRFKSFPHIHLYLGCSSEVLRSVRSSIKSDEVLYFLDAHWCLAANTTGELSQCPLLNELEAIKNLGEQSVIIIDDARLFLSTPPAPHEISHWPDLQQVISSLSTLSKNHELMIINDLIVFYPKLAKFAMRNYAYNHGVDWLRAFKSIPYLIEAEKKELVIHQLLSDLSSKERDLVAKEACIQRQSRTIKAYRVVYGQLPFIGFLARVLRRLHEIIRPRLGNLSQYPPRPLVIQKRLVEFKNFDYPSISIVTPSYGQGEFIERTIQSVLNQNYSNLEYYVKDGGSEDGTIEILQRYEQHLAGWVSCKDNGQSHAINIGFSKTSGQIMGWLNSDDLLLPNTLKLVAKYFHDHPDIDVVYGNRLMIDEDDMEIGRWILPGHDNNILSWVDYIPQETLFWRRDLWERIGGAIDESFYFAMDWDLLVRFRDAGAKFAHLSQFMGAFRIHMQQKTSAAISHLGNQEMDRIRKRILGRTPSRSEIHKAQLPYLIKHIGVDMLYRVKARVGSKL